METRPDWKKPLAAASVAVAANVLVVLYAQELLGTSPEFMPLTYGPVAVFTALGAIAGYSVLQLKKKYSDRPYEHFMYLSSGVLVLSFVSVIYQAPLETGAGLEEIAVLSLTHVVAAVFTVAVLLKLELEDLEL